MNQRPSGYEPDELPDCSTPRHETKNILLTRRRVNLGIRSLCHACESPPYDWLLNLSPAGADRL